MRNDFSASTRRNADQNATSRVINKSAMAALLGGAALTMLAETAGAATGSGSIAVSATLVAACSVSGAAINFGTINPITVTGAVNAEGLINMKCTNTTPYAITLDGGTHQGSSATARNMQNVSNGSTLLAYQVYLNTNRTTIWGGTLGPSGFGTGSNRQVTVYAQIPNAATVAPGDYSDTLTMTITY